ncbi:hypothetical protein [Turicibacter sp.]|uniref:hypothetical protein n=1 Tax=Turicibacter sp. TaxID=2049042 RepID=UPI001B7BACA2|nr:hypothetical protein [Turicibacter sp.]MBP3905282.1 HNH endonuclease [Turicibacter sp.]
MSYDIDFSVYEIKRPKINYNEHIKSKEWKEFKKEVCELRNYKCQCCGVKKKSNLHLHHKHYKTLGSERLEDVELLCMKCHNLLHHKGRAAMEARGEQVKADRKKAKQLKKANKNSKAL